LRYYHPAVSSGRLTQALGTTGTLMSILDFLAGNIFVRRDGSSAKRAVIVNSVAEEYAVMKRRFPGFRLNLQSLQEHDGKPYDVLEIANASGEKRILFFDVSSFVGK
jgi:hypothetical protein